MTSMQETIKAIEKEISCVENSISKINQFQNKLDENGSTVKAQINDIIGMLGSLLRQREAELQQEVDTIMSSQKSSLQTKLTELYQKLGSLQVQLQMAKEGKQLTSSKLYYGEIDKNGEAPSFKFQSSEYEGLQEAILGFGSIKLLSRISSPGSDIAHENIQNQGTAFNASAISQWLQNVDCGQSSSSDFELIDKIQPSSPSIISIRETESTRTSETVPPVSHLTNPKCFSGGCDSFVCKESSCCQNGKLQGNVDVESICTPWLKRSHESNQAEASAQNHPIPLSMPKLSEVCKANEKCRYFDQCLSDENCLVTSLLHQLEGMHLQPPNAFYDNINEAIKGWKEKSGEKNDEEKKYWRDLDIWLQNYCTENMPNDDKESCATRNEASKRKGSSDELTDVWLSKVQRLGNNRCTRKYNFSIPNFNWLRKQDTGSNKKDDVLQNPVVPYSMKGFSKWLAKSKNSPSLECWLKQSCSTANKKEMAAVAKKKVFPEDSPFLSKDLSMWLVPERRDSMINRSVPVCGIVH